MDWMQQGWNSDLDAAYESALRLGAIIAREKAWPPQWVTEFETTAAEIHDAVKGKRGLLASDAAAMLGVQDRSAEAAEFWRGLAGAILLDADPKTGLGAPPAGYGDIYMVGLQASGAATSKAELEQAAGLWAQVSGTVVLTAEDVKAAGAAIPAAVEKAGGGVAKAALALAVLYGVSKIL